MATGVVHFFDANRLISSAGNADGALVYFYYSGTSNLAPIYADITLTSPVSNPVTVAVGAVLPNIYLDPTITYRRRTVFASDSTVHDEDPIAVGADASLIALAEAESLLGEAQAYILNGGTPFANTYATTLPKGVTALSAVGVGTGTGGTPGTYAGGVSGGPAGFAWTYTIGSDGKVASYTITNPGLASATTLPTLSYPSGSLTTPTLPVPAVASIIPDRKAYCAASSDSSSVLAFYNNGGTIANLNNPDGTQISFLNAREFRRFMARSSTWRNTSYVVSNPYLLRVRVNLIMVDGTTPPACYTYDIRRDLTTRCSIDIKRISDNLRIGALSATTQAAPVAASINPTTFSGANAGVGQVTLPLVLTAEAIAAGFSTSSNVTIDWGGGETWGGVQDGTTTNHALNSDNMGFDTASRQIIAGIARQEIAATDFDSAFDVTATSLNAYLEDIVEDIMLWNAKAHDYRISFVQTSSGVLNIDVWDEVLGGPIGYFQISSPNYGALPERIMMVSSNRVPGTYPATAGYSGVQGWIKLRASRIIVSGSAYSYTTAEEGRINRNKRTTKYQYSSRHWADDFQEIIEVGPTRTYTTIRQALTSLYDGGALAAQTNSAQLPVCLRANPNYKIALVFDPGTYYGVSEHVPDWVYLGGKYRNATILEHDPAATSSLIEGQANTGAFDLTIRNNRPVSAQAGAGASSCYGWHTDYVHLVQSPDSVGDYNRSYSVDFHRVRFIIGPNADIQCFGSGLTMGAEANFTDCELLCENNAYGGPILAFNTSSSSIGGGKVNIRNTWDRTGRSPTVSSIAVQTKLNNTYPNILNIDGCRGFSQVSLSPGVSGSFVGKWLLTGNNTLTASNISSTIAGDTLGL